MKLPRIVPGIADLRHAARALTWKWRFAAGVVFTLGLGIGLGVPVLSLADHFFLRPPPGVTDADRVVRLVLRGHNKAGTYMTDGLSGLDYEMLRVRARTISGVAGWSIRTMSMGSGADARPIAVTQATPSFFSVLGARPFAGRFYTDGEDVQDNTQPPAVVSHRFWIRALSADPTALGRKLRIGAKTYTIVGITRPGFNGLTFAAVDVWLPLHVAAPEWQSNDPRLWTTDGSAWLRVVARLRPGATMEQATTEVAHLYRSSGPRIRDGQMRGSMLWDPVEPGRSVIPDRTAKLALWLSAGGLLLLALIGANLTNLFRARAAAQTRQTAIRLAVGGTWQDLLRGLAAEAFLLGIAASVIGLGISAPATRVSRLMLFPGVDWIRPVIDLRIVVIAFVLAFGIGGVVALWSTMQATRADPADLLRGGATGDYRSRRGAGTFRRTMLVVQSAIFTILLAGAAAFVTSLQNATRLDFGFDASVMSARVPLPLETPRERATDLMIRARDRVAAMPEVASASLGYMEPWRNNTELPVTVPGSAVKPPSILFDMATPEYPATFGLRMRSGRWIQRADGASAAAVVVINEALERIFWPVGTSVGRCLRVGGDSMPCRTIVGVVRDFRVTGRVEDAPVPVYWLPVAQTAGLRQRPILFIRPRPGVAVEALARSARNILQTLEPGLAAATVEPVMKNVEWLHSPLRLGASVFGAFGMLAAIVGGVGLLSVLSFIVVEQRRTHALKIALGGTAADVAASVAGFAAATTAAGMILGFAALILLKPVVDPLLFRATLIDLPTLAGVAVLGVVICLVATIPATWSVFRIQVMTTLREQ